MCVLSLVEILPLVLLVRLGLVAKHVYMYGLGYFCFACCSQSVTVYVYVWAGLLLAFFVQVQIMTPLSRNVD